MRRALLLALVAGLVAAAPADAATRVFPVSATNAPPFRVFGSTDTPALGGPFLAGEDVLFLERRRGALALVSDGPAGRRDLDEIPDDIGDPRAFDFDVAEGQVALTTFRVSCNGDLACLRYRGEFPQDFAMRTGPATGPLHVVLGCGMLTVDAAAGALAGRCASQGYDVHEEGQAPRPVASRPSVVVRVAGEYLAEGVAEGVRVLRRATGEEVFHVDVPIATFDLAPDGAVAYAIGGAAEVGWSSPADPAVHRLAVPGPPLDLQVDGDQIAVRLAVARGRRMLVVDRAGVPVADVIEPAPVADFDLERGHLVWARQPCSRQAIVVWEIAGAPPLPGGDDCTMPTVPPGTLRLRADRSLAFPLSCPATAPAGCAGVVGLSILLRRAGGPLRLRAATARPFDLLPGESTSFRLRLGRRDVKRFMFARVEAELELLRRQQAKAVRPLRLKPRR